MNFFSRLAMAFKVLFSTVFGRVLVEAAENILNNLGKETVDALTRFAEREVALVDAQDIPGAEKHDVVLAALKKQALAKGVEVATSQLNMIIESVVNRLKG